MKAYLQLCSAIILTISISGCGGGGGGGGSIPPGISVTSLVISPSNRVVLGGSTTTYNVTASLSDGTIVTPIAGVIWTVIDDNGVTLANFTGGTFNFAAPTNSSSTNRRITISATYNPGGGGKTASIHSALTFSSSVSVDTLSLTLVPSSTTMNEGESRTFKAKLTFVSGNAVNDVTADYTSDPLIGSFNGNVFTAVSNVGANSGVPKNITATVASGGTTISTTQALTVNHVAANVNISGSAIDTNGTPVQGVVFVFRNAIGTQTGSATTLANGSFSANVSNDTKYFYIAAAPNTVYTEFKYPNRGNKNFQTNSSCTVQIIPNPTTGGSIGTFIFYFNDPNGFPPPLPEPCEP